MVSLNNDRLAVIHLPIAGGGGLGVVQKENHKSAPRLSMGR
jgi:hypothetical protein